MLACFAKSIHKVLNKIKLSTSRHYPNSSNLCKNRISNSRQHEHYWNAQVCKDKTQIRSQKVRKVCAVKWRGGLIRVQPVHSLSWFRIDAFNWDTWSNPSLKSTFIPLSRSLSCQVSSKPQEAQRVPWPALEYRVWACAFRPWHSGASRWSPSRQGRPLQFLFEQHA